ncbi:hypothetical protein PISMIDRAFT_670586 [Pisolithus microcarpus 441]|uniref:Uncharacterized protein n=1 Tax=Pisolithus microcarpus 441 TaxID=765257 RepID=A0A0D0AEM7_9AGAM|nr:hypothetical protein PISMIDRAFT_670586 [Pisolithus microcarpus 441]
MSLVSKAPGELHDAMPADQVQQPGVHTFSLLAVQGEVPVCLLTQVLGVVCPCAHKWRWTSLYRNDTRLS